MRQIQLAVVGCGDIARFTALLSRLVPQVALAACCDVDRKRAEAFARRHRIPRAFADYAEMLAEAPCDAVYLAVPHFLHYEMILGAVQAGRSVLVEKPLTRTLAEGVALVAAAGDAKIGVNYQYRYDRGCHALARAVQRGDLGRVHSVRINVPWRRTQSYFDAAPWHRSIAHAGGGTLITQGSHFLDVALWALGEAPVSASGYVATPGFDVEVDTLAHGTVETSGGALVTITATMAAAKERAVTIEVFGSTGTAIYTNRPWPRVTFEGVRPVRERSPGRGVHALQKSLAGFARWVLDGEPYLVPAASTLPVLAAVDGIYRAAASGRREAIAV
jgi:predicted dehydrogenase